MAGEVDERKAAWIFFDSSAQLICTDATMYVRSENSRHVHWPVPEGTLHMQQSCKLHNCNNYSSLNSFAAVKLNGDHVALFFALLEESHLVGSEQMAHPCNGIILIGRGFL